MAHWLYKWKICVRVVIQPTVSNGSSQQSTANNSNKISRKTGIAHFVMSVIHCHMSAIATVLQLCVIQQLEWVHRTISICIAFFLLLNCKWTSSTIILTGHASNGYETNHTDVLTLQVKYLNYLLMKQRSSICVRNFFTNTLHCKRITKETFKFDIKWIFFKKKTPYPN